MMRPVLRRSLRIVWLGAPLAMLGAGFIASSCAVGAEDPVAIDQPEAAAPAAESGPDGAQASESEGGDGPTGPTGTTGGEDGATGPGPTDDASGDDAADGSPETDGGSESGGGEKDAGDGGDAGRKDGGEDAGIVDSGNEHDAADAAAKDGGGPTDAGHDAGEPDSAPVDAGADAGSDADVDACGPAALPLLINEVQTSGSGGADDEWIEIFNPMGCPVDISGWTLRHTSTSGTTIDKVFTATTGTVIAAGGYGVVAGTSYSASAPTIGNLSSGVLSDTGGGLGLYDENGTIVDSMGYGTGATNPFVETAPAPAEGASQSIARVPNGTETGDNATDFTAASPTPGAKN